MPRNPPPPFTPRALQYDMQCPQDKHHYREAIGSDEPVVRQEEVEALAREDAACQDTSDGEASANEGDEDDRDQSEGRATSESREDAPREYKRRKIQGDPSVDIAKEAGRVVFDGLCGEDSKYRYPKMVIIANIKETAAYKVSFSPAIGRTSRPTQGEES